MSSAASGLRESATATVIVDEASKWYGEILGLNRVSLRLQPGVTSLVGPNGSGKSTLMNLIAGLLRPSKGRIDVLGVSPSHPEELHRVLGYCSQYDTFPLAFTGEDFVVALLRLRCGPVRARAMAARALDRVGLLEPRRKKIGAYSKGMRQRLKLALALAHEPQVLILDEPLNGLDPLGRSEVMALFRELATNGSTVLLSSHILHEVNEISRAVLMLQHGYVVAEGGISEVRGEIRDKPFQVRVRCSRPALLAARSFESSLAVGARTEPEAVLVETFDPIGFCRLVASIAARDEVEVSGIDMADENVQAVYEYLIRPEASA